jgi:F-type H+-transporting ATPase subunit b
MNAFTLGVLVAAETEPHRDDNGQIVTHHWLWPEASELIFGSIASIIIFGLLYKFAGPAIKKAFNGRTERIQADLDSAAEAVVDADADATRIRDAKGDIDAERGRLFAEADAQAEALLNDGRARLDREVADLEARAETELASNTTRVGDEMRAEIARIVQDATDGVVAESLDTATDEALIEAFIQRVGAS